MKKCKSVVAFVLFASSLVFLVVRCKQSAYLGNYPREVAFKTAKALLKKCKENENPKTVLELIQFFETSLLVTPEDIGTSNAKLKVDLKSFAQKSATVEYKKAVEMSDEYEKALQAGDLELQKKSLSLCEESLSNVRITFAMADIEAKDIGVSEKDFQDLGKSSALKKVRADLRALEEEADLEAFGSIQMDMSNQRIQFENIRKGLTFDLLCASFKKACHSRANRAFAKAVKDSDVASFDEAIKIIWWGMLRDELSGELDYWAKNPDAFRVKLQSQKIALMRRENHSEEDFLEAKKALAYYRVFVPEMKEVTEIVEKK